MCSVEENSAFFLLGAAAAGARRTSARITAIVERIALPPCVRRRRLCMRREGTARGHFVAPWHLSPRGPSAWRVAMAISKQGGATTMGRSILVAVLAAGVGLLTALAGASAQQ